MMNLKNITLLIVLCSLIFLTSCEKNSNLFDGNLTEIKKSDFDEFLVDGLYEPASSNDIEDFYSCEKELGEFLHTWIKSLILPSDWDSLSSQDQSTITYFMDDQYAMLAIWDQLVNEGIMAPDYYGSTQSSSGNSNMSNNSEKNPSVIITCCTT